MSEGGGEPIKNGAEEPVNGTDTEVKCPEVDFSPYDEHGRPKPFVAICPCPPTCEPAQPETDNDQQQEQPKNGEPKTPEKKQGDQPSDATPESTPPAAPRPENLDKDFSHQFKLFSKFGDTKSDGRHITLSQSDKWMKQAKVISKQITTTDTGIHFKKLKSLKVTESEYKKFLDELSKAKNTTVDDLMKKMVACGAPGLSVSQPAVVGVKTPSAFTRLTDTSKYTGCHKQRFDETGKGRGIAGRRDLNDNSGYVTGYTNKNTYDKKNPSK